MLIKELFGTFESKDDSPVGVPKLTPGAKLSRKAAQLAVKAYGNHIKTSGYNQTYAKKHPKEMNEGMYVVKSADGVEKRFKSAESAEAREWARSIKKKVKAPKYSHEWWEAQSNASDDSVFVTPWKKIDGYDDSDAMKKVVKEQGQTNIEDWSSRPGKNMNRDGVPCATAVVRVVFKYTKDDDLGLDHDMEDSQSMLVARNPKKPAQLDFIKYTH